MKPCKITGTFYRKGTGGQNSPAKHFANSTVRSYVWICTGYRVLNSTDEIRKVLQGTLMRLRWH